LQILSEDIRTPHINSTTSFQDNEYISHISTLLNIGGSAKNNIVDSTPPIRKNMAPWNKTTDQTPPPFLLLEGIPPVL
jgi:hypothetical protein